MEDQGYLRSGAGIIALEAYHAGAVRMLLLQKGATVVAPFSVGLADVTVVRQDAQGRRVWTLKVEISMVSGSKG